MYNMINDKHKNKHYTKQEISKKITENSENDGLYIQNAQKFAQFLEFMDKLDDEQM